MLEVNKLVNTLDLIHFVLVFANVIITLFYEKN